MTKEPTNINVGKRKSKKVSARGAKKTPLEKAAEWTLLAVIFFLPLQTRWIAIDGQLNGTHWEYGTISLYGLDILIGIFLLFAVGHIVLEKKQFRPSSSQLLALLLLTITFFSLLFANNAISGLFWWAKFAEGAALVLTIPLLNLKQKWLANTFIIAAVIQSLLAYTQFVGQKVIGAKWLGMADQLPTTLGVQVINTDLGRVLRAYGSLPHPNMLAGFLAAALIVCLVAYTTYKKNDGLRLAYASSLTIISLGLWLTFSRQALLAVGLAIATLTLATFLNQKKFPARSATGIIIMLIPMIVFTGLFPELIATRISGQARLEQKSLNERQEYLEQSYGLLQNDWITGVGIGNYTAELQRQDEANHTELEAFNYQPVHNIYLLIFTELGIFGILTFFLLIFSLLFKVAWNKKWTLGWGLALASFLIIGAFDHYLWSLHFGIILFWICLAFFLHSKQSHA